eukprot:6196451-Pleurochrysis_carterae.AAC.4
MDTYTTLLSPCGFPTSKYGSPYSSTLPCSVTASAVATADDYSLAPVCETARAARAAAAGLNTAVPPACLQALCPRWRLLDDDKITTYLLLGCEQRGRSEVERGLWCRQREQHVILPLLGRSAAYSGWLVGTPLYEIGLGAAAGRPLVPTPSVRLPMPRSARVRTP